MIKKWWFWVGIIIFGLFLWQYFSGWAMSSKLYKIALDNLREDQTRIVKTLEGELSQRETEIAGLEKEKKQLQKNVVLLQKRDGESVKEITRLEGVVYDLRVKLKNVVVSTDPDILIGDLQKRFPSVKRKR
jgi:cell division protein FtsB